ncbi:transcription elongation factor 1 homolog [Drosophila innubila]|uniref:transcription elongation factor 1 homolog n=1 Tax=Drosophila innubila TaxID=198719 RepID=UPI00148E51BF|nr:transcription elongation factor 1 homolog [Drosophila innubila]XP_034482664.1 transcription elongation factor 1 homolog [Drosophila innubila]
MGRRKSKRKPPPRRKLIKNMEKQFNCPFCNHEKSCEVSLDKRKNVGRITCRVCKEYFQTPIISLSEAIDVYNDWIDACEQIN